MPAHANWTFVGGADYNIATESQVLLGEINFPEPFPKICANRLPVFIISFVPLATLLQFLGYVLAHHFLAQLHEQKSFNHL